MGCSFDVGFVRVVEAIGRRLATGCRSSPRSCVPLWFAGRGGRDAFRAPCSTAGAAAMMRAVGRVLGAALRGGGRPGRQRRSTSSRAARSAEQVAERRRLPSSGATKPRPTTDPLPLASWSLFPPALAATRFARLRIFEAASLVAASSASLAANASFCLSAHRVAKALLESLGAPVGPGSAPRLSPACRPRARRQKPWPTATLALRSARRRRPAIGKRNRPIAPCSTRCFREADCRKSWAGSSPMIVPGDHLGGAPRVANSNGQPPSNTSSMTPAAITAASMELRPSLAQ